MEFLRIWIFGTALAIFRFLVNFYRISYLTTYLGFSWKFDIFWKIPWRNFRFRNFQNFEFFINIINDVPGSGEHVGVILRPSRLEKPPKTMLFSWQIKENHSFFMVFSVRTCSVQPTCLQCGSYLVYNTVNKFFVVLQLNFFIFHYFQVSSWKLR